ncbi:hypothetical protein MHH81_20520 [Psychrobacillus sp. FSL H8-0484]|uniref:hypothetical protein n=1 Tax=Psychrobacillus sp. FSL H8-0484 TaxID=2921390 RepID=UPI0030F92CD9
MAYLEKRFPLIMHAAIPVRLNEELRSKVNIILDRYTSILSNVIKQMGRNINDYIFFAPHDLAIILTKDQLIFTLCKNNKSLFLTGLYCFELDFEVDETVLNQILKNQFNFHDFIHFKFSKQILELSGSELDEYLLKQVLEFEEMEAEIIRRGKSIMDVRPKVFSNTDVRIKEKYCFVLMPFKDELTEVYEDCIKLALNEVDYQCERADDIFHNTSIIEVIWTKICSAEIIIADLTDKNPNVFYEVGIAHTLGKEVILLTQNSEDVPFDLRHLRYIHYSNTGRGLSSLKDNLITTIKSINADGMEYVEHQ